MLGLHKHFSLYFTLSLLPQNSHDASLLEIWDHLRSRALRNSLKSDFKNYSHILQRSDINIEISWHLKRFYAS